MKKEIVITEDKNGGINFRYTGFTPIEVLGLLRFQEKRVWLGMVKSVDPVRENNPDEPCAPKEKPQS